MPPDLLAVIEGLALRRPASTIAAVHRQAAEVPGRQGWPAPSYGTVYAVVRGLDPALVTLAHQPDRYREAFVLVWGWRHVSNAHATLVLPEVMGHYLR